MPKYLTCDEAFLKCRKEGRFIFIENVDFNRIKSTLAIAESDVLSAEIIKKNLKKSATEWNGVFKLYYDALHELTEAFLSLGRVKVENHQCLFAYLCEKHPELDFDWELLERVRTKRNGINYYGSPVGYEDWKQFELQFVLYTNKLKEVLKERLTTKNS